MDSPITITTSSVHMLEPGMTIVVSGCVDSKLGGVWPRFLRWMPEKALWGTQWLVYKLTGFKFGPQKYIAVDIETTSLTVR